LTRPEIPVYSRARRIIGFVLAAISAVATPFLSGFCTTIMFPTIICTLLYGFAGMGPAAAAMVLQTAAFGLLGGLPMGVVAICGFVLPAAFIIRSLRWRIGFFGLLKQGIIAQMLGMVGALAAARIFYGPDLIGQIAALLRTSLETMFTPGLVDMILDNVFAIDSVPDSMTQAQLITGVLEPARRAEYLDGFVTQLSATLRLTLPGSLLSAVCLTGILAVTWPAKLIDRRKNVNGAYVKLARWYTPWQISVGLIATWTVTWILEAIGIKGADVLYLAIQSLLLMAFRVQAAISMERRLTQMNMRPFLRVFFILGLQLLLPADMVMFYGAFSALFGMTGAMLQIRILRGKSKNPNDNNDDMNN